MEYKIGDKIISEGAPVFLIAEAGINHNGDIDIAHELIDAAASSGADAVKFQTFITEEIIHPNCPNPSHEINNIGDNISHFDLVKKWELQFDQFIELKKHCKEKNVIFISTPYDLESAKFLIKLKSDAIKVASAEMINFPLIELLGKTEIPIILSTGMNYWDEIVESVDFLSSLTKKICILKCTSNYPASPESINLNGLNKIKKKYPNIPIGFSDHSEGQEISLASLSLGVNIIEKHFTLDKNLWGPDHRASMNPLEFKAFVSSVRKVEKSLGKFDWSVQKEEKSQRSTMQKGIYARQNLFRGDFVAVSDIKILRPRGDITPKDYYLNYKNRKLKNDITKGSPIKGSDFDF